MTPSSVRSVSVTTSWASLPSVRGEQVSILNNTGADLDVRHSGQTSAGQLITLKDGQSVGLKVAASSTEIQIKAASGAAGVQVVVG